MDHNVLNKLILFAQPELKSISVSRCICVLVQFVKSKSTWADHSFHLGTESEVVIPNTAPVTWEGYGSWRDTVVDVCVS